MDEVKSTIREIRLKGNLIISFIAKCGATAAENVLEHGCIPIVQVLQFRISGSLLPNGASR